MYIHLGGDTMIRSNHLIAIFDLCMEQASVRSSNYIDDFINKENIKKIGKEKPKSLVITEGQIFYSPISSSTLKKRANVISDQLMISLA